MTDFRAAVEAGLYADDIAHGDVELESWNRGIQFALALIKPGAVLVTEAELAAAAEKYYQHHGVQFAEYAIAEIAPPWAQQ
jgi:hypothetical protein